MNELLNYELLHTQSMIITVGSIVLFFTILGATRLLIRLISAMLKRTMRSRPTSDGRHASFVQLISYLLWVFGVILGLQSLGVNISFLVASSAALLVGVGLGLQNVFKDFISGIIILMEGTVKSGDVVEIDGWVVKVRDVSLRTSTVVTREDKVVIIPNHKFIEENVINWSHNDGPTRFDLDIGVDYASDIYQVQEILLECARQNPDILNTESQPAFVRFQKFGSSSLDFQLVFWSNNMFRIETTKSNLRFAIVDAFQKNGISIPFTQVVLHQATVPASEEMSPAKNGEKAEN